MTNAIKAMYSTFRSIIKHNRQTSNTITSNVGVNQGDPSSFLLFMMFENDTITSINTDLDDIFSTEELKLFLVLFADDKVLFYTSPTTLQSMLNDIETYCNAWGLKVNVAKTKVLIFEQSNRVQLLVFFCSSVPVMLFGTPGISGCRSRHVPVVS